jgi:predicted dehydrogenase
VSRLRIAIVGCGAVTERYHLPAITTSADVKLVALVDPVQERAETLAATFGVDETASDHAALVGRVDAAIVATPNHLHASVAAELASAGVHVLVEKPLAVTAAQCAEIEAAVQAGGVVGAVGHDFRHFPIARAARELVAAGVAGEIAHVELLQSSGSRWPYASAYVYRREQSGGGVLVDFGVHMLDLLRWWLGELTVTAYRDDAAGGVETECELELETAAGTPVHFVLTRLRELRDTTVIRGDRAALEIGIFDPSLLRLTLRTGTRIDGDAPDAEFATAPLRTVFRRQLDDFVAAVRTGGEPLVPLRDGRRAVELVEAAYALRRPLRRAWDWPDAYARLTEEAS